MGHNAVEGGARMTEPQRPVNWVVVAIIGAILTLFTNVTTAAIIYAATASTKSSTNDATLAVEIKVLQRSVDQNGKKLDDMMKQTNDNATQIALNKSNISKLEELCKK